MWAELFEGGDVDKGKVMLLSTLTENEQTGPDSFRLGVKIGVIAMLVSVLAVILFRPVESFGLLEQMQLFAPIYRCTGLMIMLLWFWAGLVWIWDRFRIPYVLLFQINPRTRMRYQDITSEAADLTIVYLINSLFFLTHSGRVIHERFSLGIYPLALFLFLALKFCMPTRIVSHWSSRSYLLAVLGQIFISPFGKLRFVETFVADILTSTVKVVVDVEASICILVNFFLQGSAERDSALVNGAADATAPTAAPGAGAPTDTHSVTVNCVSVSRIVVPILCALPLWWRFLQCLRRYYDSGNRSPHLYNAAKYLLTHTVVIMVAYHPVFNDHHSTTWATYRVVWLLFCVLSSLYNTWWDTVMDWGLLSRSDPHPVYPFLRKDLRFEKHVWLYYTAMVSNVFLRWLWISTIIPFSFEDGQDKRYRVRSKQRGPGGAMQPLHTASETLLQRSSLTCVCL